MAAGGARRGPAIGDPKFLVGDTAIGRGVGAGEIINTQDEIKHLDHVMKRFPGERRFVLAQGIARDCDWQDDALVAYKPALDDRDVGGEASMRLGAMQIRQIARPTRCGISSARKP